MTVRPLPSSGVRERLQKMKLQKKDRNEGWKCAWMLVRATESPFLTVSVQNLIVSGAGAGLPGGPE